MFFIFKKDSFLTEENELPNSLNASKRLRQNKKVRLHNKSIKSTVRTSIKAFDKAVFTHDKTAAEQAYTSFVKLIDTAAGKGIYHKNTAARKKSRLHKVLVNMK
ncbi:MAG: 30S ribosomal protein S20 [Spirochaetaceae bacterium]|jgi:small subunit ribosomal protein S20|nr:30S ribosomal protein S20 [Spirochaetaceae bacterium]